MRNSHWVTAFVILNSAMYLLLLLSEWLLPDWARLNASILGSVGGGLCAIFGAKLINGRSTQARVSG